MTLKDFLKEFLNIQFTNATKPRSSKLLIKDKKELGNELTKALIKIKRLEKKDPELEKENYYNNKYKQSPILYSARNNKLYDVRSFITYPSTVLSNLRIQIQVYPSDSNDTKARKVLVWIINNFNYKSDEGEYWSFPTDSLYTKHGDCEDGTHLLVSLLRNLGIPAYRIKVCCGWVIDPNTKQRYGHSYPIYLRESDDTWVTLDWCFLPNVKPVINRIAHKEDNNYEEIWFTFNDIHSWSEHETTTTGRIREEEIR